MNCSLIKNLFIQKKNNKPHALLKIVKEGERPKIKNEDGIPELYIELITKCWEEEPNKRPSFLEIVKGLMDYRDEYLSGICLDTYIKNAT